MVKLYGDKMIFRSNISDTDGVCVSGLIEIEGRPKTMLCNFDHWFHHRNGSVLKRELFCDIYVKVFFFDS